MVATPAFEVGQRIGRLLVTKVYSPKRCDQFRIACVCDCGMEVDTRGSDLKGGKLKSCGCYRRDRAGGLYRKHGLSHTPAYVMFYDARKRAIAKGLPFSISPADIKIPSRCPVLGVELLATGPRDARPSLDRIKPGDGYTPGNIRVISFRANRIKSDATAEELRAAGLPLRQKGNAWRVKDPDGPRYKALGNSMAVPVMRFIGERIQMVEDLTNG